MSTGAPSSPFAGVAMTSTGGKVMYSVTSGSFTVDSSTTGSPELGECYLCNERPDIGIFVRGKDGRIASFCKGCVTKLNGGVGELITKLEVMEAVKEEAK